MAIPLYQEHGSTYRADTCGPVRTAVVAGQLEHQALVHGQYPGRRLPRGVLSGVKTVGYWDAGEPQDWGLDWHRNEGIEFTWLERGSLGFAVDHATCRLRPDDLTITRPWQLHRVGDPLVGAGRLHWLILDVAVRRPHQPWRWPPWIVLTKHDLHELTNCLRLNEQPVWHATPELGVCFQRIAAAVIRDRDGSSGSLLAALLNELLVLALDMFRHRQVPLDESLASSQRTVELFWADVREHQEHLAAEWTVGLMARRCGLGVTQFIYLTKRLFNMTPVQYLSVCRLESAAALLRAEPTASVAAVAAACGFTSSRYFATLFGRHFRCTPSALRDAAGKPR
jgi:AraC family L-rhamnose operon regulatory protein RhaS